jgi:hypothetical protein
MIEILMIVKVKLFFEGITAQRRNGVIKERWAKFVTSPQNNCCLNYILFKAKLQTSLSSIFSLQQSHIPAVAPLRHYAVAPLRLYAATPLYR